MEFFFFFVTDLLRNQFFNRQAGFYRTHYEADLKHSVQILFPENWPIFTVNFEKKYSTEPLILPC